MTKPEYPFEGTLEDYHSSIAKVNRRLLQQSSAEADAVQVRMDTAGIAELHVHARNPTSERIEGVLDIACDWIYGCSLRGAKLASIALSA